MCDRRWYDTTALRRSLTRREEVMAHLRFFGFLITTMLFLSIGLDAATSTRRHVRRPARRVYVKKRSKKKSAAIIGGSAATGAAIGALAGGGKGAGIGALAGGAGGLVYDRNTNKKRVR
jgi:hypothetical protein